MPEKLSPAQRSLNMSRVKGRGNRATELRLIEIFRNAKVIGWRRNYQLFGKPDFVFPKQRLVVFVDGCFWHSCPKHRSQPVNNGEFWRRKLENNRTRDRLVTKELKILGWTVIRIWQHELTKPNKIKSRLSNLMRD